VTIKVTKETTGRTCARIELRGRVLALGLLAPLLATGCSTTTTSPAPSAAPVAAVTDVAACPETDPRQEASDRFHRGKAHALAGDAA
jgi:hypothetical protein